MELRGRRVLVTGGGGGIGRALAGRFALAGCAVLVADRDADAAGTTAATIRDGGGEALELVLDVTSRESVLRVRDELQQRDALPDVLVNNAGLVHGGAFAEVDLDRHLDTYRVNVLGLVAVTHAFLPDLVARPAGWIVNIASASAFLPLPFGATYASSKWAVVGLSESLRRELRLTGSGHVGVTTVCPSYVDTGLFAGARPARTTRLLTTEEIAERTVRAVTRGAPFVMAPWSVRLLPLFRGLLPTFAFDRVLDALGATRSMEGWRGRSGPARGDGGTAKGPG